MHALCATWPRLDGLAFATGRPESFLESLRRRSGDFDGPCRVVWVADPARGPAALFFVPR